MGIVVWVVLIAVWTASLFAFDRIAKDKGRPEMWPLGIFGPISVVFIALLPTKRQIGP